MLEENDSYPGRDIADQKLKLFFDEIIKPHLPNYEVGFVSMGGEYPTSANVTMSSMNAALQGSRFDYPNNNCQFIHFTNIYNARSILSQGCIYLSGLNTSKDKNEIDLNLKAFNRQWDHQFHNPNIKGNFLCLSMMQFSEEEKFITENYSSILNNYHEFGGNFPIGLVLEIDTSNKESWWRFHLSGVSYSDTENTPPQFLSQIVLDAKNWSEKNSFDIQDLHHALYPLMAFFKEHKYKIENEVRLVKAPMDSCDNYNEQHYLLNGLSINNDNELVKIEKLYFEGEAKERILANANLNDSALRFVNNTRPKIHLKKVLLPTIKYEKISLKNTFHNVLLDLGMNNVEVKYMEFNNQKRKVMFF